MTDEHAGSPEAAGVNFGAYEAQPVTFPTAGTWDRIRAAFSSGGGKVGYSRTQPTNTDAVTWACSATFTGTTGWAEATLDTPLTVSAGETVWVVCRGDSTTTNLTATAMAGNSPTGGVTIGNAIYGSSSGAALGGSSAYFLNVQAVRTAVAAPPSGQLWPRRKPAAPGASGQLWPRG